MYNLSWLLHGEACPDLVYCLSLWSHVKKLFKIACEVSLPREVGLMYTISNRRLSTLMWEKTGTLSNYPTRCLSWNQSMYIIVTMYYTQLFIFLAQELGYLLHLPLLMTDNQKLYTQQKKAGNLEGNSASWSLNTIMCPIKFYVLYFLDNKSFFTSVLNWNQ